MEPLYNSSLIKDLVLLNIGYFAAVFQRIVPVAPYMDIEKIKYKSLRKIIEILRKYNITKFLRKGMSGFILAAIPFVLNPIFIIVSNWGNKSNARDLLVYFIVSIVTFICVWIGLKCEEGLYNVKQLDDTYIDFCKKIDEDSEMFIIAGDLTFLGEVVSPEDMWGKREKRERKICSEYLQSGYKDGTECNNVKDCKSENCHTKTKQFRQLVDLQDRKKIKLNLLVRKPNESDIQKLIIARLMEIYGDDIRIKFYKDEIIKGEQPLARIKKYNGLDMICYHWKNPDGTYGAVIHLDSSRPQGKRQIFLYKSLWEVSEELTDFKEYNEILKKKLQ